MMIQWRDKARITEYLLKQPKFLKVPQPHFTGQFSLIHYFGLREMSTLAFTAWTHPKRILHRLKLYVQDCGQSQTKFTFTH